MALLDAKATAEEVEAYKHFTVSLAERVAKAHHERGNEDNVSDAERAAIDEIAGTLGVAAPRVRTPPPWTDEPLRAELLALAEADQAFRRSRSSA